MYVNFYNIEINLKKKSPPSQARIDLVIKINDELINSKLIKNKNICKNYSII